ncbi:hypothetical protein [Streptomyces nitrosporeus]|uniref:hypothetical protein n=1 Tax=Streptomyces nitrosporeus TaxID=28894 RepID=UPI0033221D10
MSRKPSEFSVDSGNVNALLSGLSNRFDNETPAQNSVDGRTARRQKEPAAPAAKPSKYSLLLDTADALALDELALQMRRLTGRRVEKSEILRVLIRLADAKPAVNGGLVKALDRRETPPS